MLTWYVETHNFPKLGYEDQKRLPYFMRCIRHIQSSFFPPLPPPLPPCEVTIYSIGTSIPTLLAVNFTRSSSLMFCAFPSHQHVIPIYLTRPTVLTIPGLYLSNKVVYILCALKYDTYCSASSSIILEDFCCDSGGETKSARICCWIGEGLESMEGFRDGSSRSIRR